MQRIVLEALAVTLGRNARARAIQLPAWNEALGLPRPWDQQWSLRIQQVLAYETDLLEYPDIFEGSVVMDGLVGELLEGARAEMARVEEHGGAVEAVPYMKAALVESHRERIARIESGEQVARRRQPLHRDRAVAADRRTPTAGSSSSTRRSRPSSARRSSAWRAARDQAAVDAALAELRAVARRRREHHAGDDRRRPRGRRRPASGRRRCATCSAPTARRPASARRPRRRRGEEIAELRDEVARVSEALGRAAEDPRRQAGPRRALQRRRADRRARARRRHGRRLRGHPPDAGADRRARRVDEGVHVIGLSILSGSHRELIPDVIEALRERGRRRARSSSAGSSPTADVAPLKRGRRRRGLHAEGLRAHADHARRRRARRGAQRRRRRGVARERRATARSSARACASATSTAAPAVLNLVENRAPRAREEIAALLRRGLPRRARRRGAGARRRRHRAAGRRQVDAAVRARRARWRGARADASRCSPSTRPPSAPAARCSATARGSTPTPPTAASSSARWPPASGSAASRPRRARPRRRWRPRSTSS